MKKFLFGLIMFFLLILISYKIFFYLDARSEKRQFALHLNKARLTKEQFLTIHEGDFILRRGFGYFSDIIAERLNNGSYDVTHAGIVVKRENKLYVIHSLSSDVSSIDGMQIQSLEHFLSYSMPDRIMVTSVKNSTPKIQQQIAQKAEFYLSKKIPFDHSGTFDNDSEFYCTELIWHILEKDLRHLKLPKESDSRKKIFMTMTSMYSPDYFDIKISTYK
ncbi:YiiX/YebB-like N1pC/P60 family cysteine hydrolase [Flavobacterium suzhouense]|uniref:YiiX/YebB-like N1pC/P60 family cysteine hydrolase n=1 Tax=Flavobacterium suzhouense TaxID=1529638 RepID=A0ABW5NQX3_9FLAO